MVASQKKKHTFTALAVSALLIGGTAGAHAQEPTPKHDPAPAAQESTSSFFQEAINPQLPKRTPAVQKTPQQASKELDAKRVQELGLKTKITESPTVLDENGNPIVPRVENTTKKRVEDQSAEPKPDTTQNAPAAANQQPSSAATAPTSSVSPAPVGNTQKTTNPQPTTTQAPAAAQGVPVNYQATGGTNTKAPTVTSNNKTKAAIVETAKTGIGGTYIWGGKSFKAWDCSGYVSWVLAQHGIKTTAYTFAMKKELKPTSTPEPGDIIFQGGYNHVGIYLGDGMMVSALNPSEGTRIHPVNIMPIDGYYTAA